MNHAAGEFLLRSRQIGGKFSYVRGSVLFLEFHFPHNEFSIGIQIRCGGEWLSQIYGTGWHKFRVEGA
ncbi:hypothetical protein M5D96_012655 [Drosophila gunungcola]|uniref:Uncharacterized protein n=1 Tax=Drosophila gunungcola TaxID=103775 RepID=A0A9P9YCW7_9MUSC|nr:hypothetical protein M5D96_012655 [Drosophila gunungcola]